MQTVGGRAGFPAPRRVVGRPFVRIQSATAWTTLALTIRTDGSSEHELVGASTFPRHWVYDRDGNLVAKSGTIDFKAWYREAHGERTPWGDEESDAFVTAAESALEREISRELMAGKMIPERRTLEPDETLVEQGAPGDELYLVLDGVSPSRSTARRSPRSGLARSSARRRSSRAARERRRSARRRAAVSR